MVGCDRIIQHERIVTLGQKAQCDDLRLPFTVEVVSAAGANEDRRTKLILPLHFHHIIGQIQSQSGIFPIFAKERKVIFQMDNFMDHDVPPVNSR
jgi:hypothetical protein